MGERRVVGRRLAAILAADVAGYSRLTCGGASVLPRARWCDPEPHVGSVSVRPHSLYPHRKHNLNRRREFMAIVAAAATWPLVAHALESRRTYRIAILSPFSADSLRSGAFLDELSRNGLVENHNLLIDWRGMGVPVTSFGAVAPELARAGPDAIVAFGPPAGLATQHATEAIPIVAMVDDPVDTGLVLSMSRPGRNTTGVGLFAAQVDAKRLEIIHELIPTAWRIGLLADPTARKSYRQVEEVARELGLELIRRDARNMKDIVPAIDALAAAKVGVIEVQFSALLFAGSPLILNRARALRLGAVYVWPEDASDGWLAVYGPSRIEAQRLLAQQLVRVLNGASPADLPFVQPTKFKLVINLKVAKVLGLTVPPSLLAQADEVIE
jgi:putative tryptophan/tyrosine transport system substrate-binding protein